MTYEDYLDLPADGKRHELIDGEHFVTPAPTAKHQTIAGNLVFQLRWFLRDHPLGRLFAAPFDVVLADTDVVQPDLVYLSAAVAPVPPALRRGSKCDAGALTGTA